MRAYHLKGFCSCYSGPRYKQKSTGDSYYSLISLANRCKVKIEDIGGMEERIKNNVIKKSK
jgi:hypothetical protein